MSTRRMTVSQAIVEFLSNQYTVDGDIRVRTIEGMYGIFGHGNVAGIAQALLQKAETDPQAMPYHQARNEQAMGHESIAYSRMTRRRSTYACAASVGPGAANLLTAAAVATTNRLPVLLLPSDTFANRVADPVLQQLELPHDPSMTVNDAFKPLSRYFDRVQRPEQLYSALLGAMRVLTDPVETGAVTIALPEDVQAEIIDVPEEFLAEREWVIRRPRPDHGIVAQIAEVIKKAKNPMIVAGGGVIYSDANQQLQDLVEATGIPVGMSQAGVGSLHWEHPQNLGAVGATGTFAANRIAGDADVIIGIGTRYSDFTTASRTAFQNPNVKFININVASFDAFKHGSSLPVVADARETIVELIEALDGYQVADDFREEYGNQKKLWDQAVDESFVDQKRDLPGQPEIIGAVNEISDEFDTVICAAGSLPGDLHKLWRVKSELGYHVEYAFSCMGYELPAAMGVRFANPNPANRITTFIGDGTFLMSPTELVTAAQEGLPITIVISENHGYQVIRRLQMWRVGHNFGNEFRYRNPSENVVETVQADSKAKRLEGDYLKVDLVSIATGLGAVSLRVKTVEEFRQALNDTRNESRPVVIVVATIPHANLPASEVWWDVEPAQVSDAPWLGSVREDYNQGRANQRWHG